MKPIKATLLIFLMTLHLLVCGEEPTKTTVYDAGLASLTFAYPKTYVTDPKSNKDEAKWWARFTSPNGDLAIEAMSHGYCSERLHDVKGFKSPEDYVLREIFGARPERTKFHGYDRLISRDSSSVIVVFLRHGAEWGRCFQQLTFHFAEGTYSRQSATIEQVINSALPCFDAKRWKSIR